MIHINRPAVFGDLFLAGSIEADLGAPAIDVVGQVASRGCDGNQRDTISFSGLENRHADAVLSRKLFPALRRSVSQGQLSVTFSFSLLGIFLPNRRMGLSERRV